MPGKHSHNYRATLTVIQGGQLVGTEVMDFTGPHDLIGFAAQAAAYDSPDFKEVYESAAQNPSNYAAVAAVEDLDTADVVFDYLAEYGLV